jgi:hypothetical protein
MVDVVSPAPSMKYLLGIGFGAGVLSAVIGDLAAQIVVITAALAGVGWVWTRLIVPAAKTLRRTVKAVGTLEDLEPFMSETRAATSDAVHAADKAAGMADQLDARLDLLERHVGLFAAEDALRIRQALTPPPPEHT